MAMTRNTEIKVEAFSGMGKSASTTTTAQLACKMQPSNGTEFSVVQQFEFIEPVGQFGTRLEGVATMHLLHDTKLDPVARAVFPVMMIVYSPTSTKWHGH